MLKTLIAIALMSCTLMANAQENDGDEYELRRDEQLGYIINKDGQKIEGIVKLAGKEDNPWMNQKKVRFIDKAAINPDKKRQKLKVMDVDDINEYVAIDEEGHERRFRMIKYTNNRESSASSGEGVGATVKMIKNFSSTTHMAEVIVDGPITVYRLYGYPSPVAVGKKDIEQAEIDQKHLIENPNLIIQKGKDKPKELTVSHISEFVKDCPVVSEKLASGGYSSYIPAKEDKKKSGFGKLLKTELDRGGNKLLDMSLEIFPDYNETCH